MLAFSLSKYDTLPAERNGRAGGQEAVLADAIAAAGWRFESPEGRETARKSSSAPLQKNAKLHQRCLGLDGEAKGPFPSTKIPLELTELSLFPFQRHDTPDGITFLQCQDSPLSLRVRSIFQLAPVPINPVVIFQLFLAFRTRQTCYFAFHPLPFFPCSIFVFIPVPPMDANANPCQPASEEEKSH
jgi:hypothetical protein